MYINACQYFTYFMNILKSSPWDEGKLMTMIHIHCSSLCMYVHMPTNTHYADVFSA